MTVDSNTYLKLVEGDLALAQTILQNYKESHRSKEIDFNIEDVINVVDGKKEKVAPNDVGGGGGVCMDGFEYLDCCSVGKDGFVFKSEDKRR